MTTEYIEKIDITGRDLYLPPNYPDITLALYLFGQVASIPCYLFVFYHLLASKKARTALYNHGTLIMLFFNFIYLTVGISLVTSFNKRGAYVPFTPAHCLTHQLVDRGVWYGAVFALIWLSLERHILIFHSTWTRTARGRWLFHYIPLAVFSLFPPCFYSYMIFIYPCEHTYDASVYLCGGPWYACSLPPSFRLFLTFGISLTPFPLLLTISGSVLLRVILQKRRLKRRNMWKQNRKMTLQFIAISATFLIFVLPSVTINIMRRVNGFDVGPNVRAFLISLADAPSIILPYATAITLPHVKEKLCKLVACKRTINPAPHRT